MTTCKCDAVLLQLKQQDALLRAILAQLRGDEPSVLCPHCCNVDPERFMNTSTMGDPRMTCLQCRKSFKQEVASG